MTATHIVLDVTELLARVENDRELLCELVEIFKAQLPGQMVSLRENIENGEMPGVVAAGHTFKGMLSNLGAARAAAAATRLEEFGKEGDRDKVGPAFIELQNEISLLIPELESCAAQVNT
jgi:HPt (histidine-containing phosphotransfer) domain-containing protein